MNQILAVVNGGAAGQGVVTSDFMFANYSLAVAAPERTLTQAWQFRFRLPDSSGVVDNPGPEVDAVVSWDIRWSQPSRTKFPNPPQLR